MNAHKEWMATLFDLKPSVWSLHVLLMYVWSFSAYSRDPKNAGLAQMETPNCPQVCERVQSG